MGKKTKIGKARKDKFYQLAKETGYRARSAFKLIQLNRKYEFLQKSRACIDLCAAPGGWLQVAHKYMPISSVIIGVDLVPIKSIGNVITLQEDITTEKCRLAIKKSLRDWKADVVLNDGAPNVGKNWLHDAFTQNQLTLSALKLACNFLAKGGHFVTKVFRSKDYQSLLYIFRQLFSKVYATKPQASRHESAEIFVYCERFLAPDKIDEKFFDVKYVFQDVDEEPVSKLNLMHPEKQRKRAEGYADGQTMLYSQVPAIDFILGSNHIEVMEKASALVLNEVLRNHSLTTEEIVECCRDIKVLGRREIRLLLTWRKKLKEIFEKIDADQSKADKDEKEPVEEMEMEENEDENVSKEVDRLQAEEAMEAKRNKKRVLKERRKLRDKMNLKMLLPNDEPMVEMDDNLFDLKRIKNKNQLSTVNEGDMPVVENNDNDDDCIGTGLSKKYSRSQHIIDDDGEFTDLSEDQYEVDSKPKKMRKVVEEDSKPEQDSDTDEELSSIGSSGEEDEDEDETAADSNPLLVDVEKDEKLEIRNKNINMWFKKDIFEGVENESDEDLDLEIMAQKNKQKVKENNRKLNEKEADESDSGNESDYNINSAMKNKIPRESVSLEVVKAGPPKKKKKKKVVLDPEGLAIGTMMIKSKKTKRDIIDDSYNKYTFNDENLPAWFADDEQKYFKKHILVSKEMVAEYKEQLKEINARPIKKVAEAKARKKKRVLRKMEKARKRAEAITDTDMTDKEKVQNIRQIYKQVVKGKKKDQDLTYVVAKRGVGKRVRRPAGVSGKFKVVDPRMKKDERLRKTNEKNARKKGNKKRKT